eukprot:Filipodium_phascolosomae@DN1097_c0_g1_i2.p1
MQFSRYLHLSQKRTPFYVSELTSAWANASIPICGIHLTSSCHELTASDPVEIGNWRNLQIPRFETRKVNLGFFEPEASTQTLVQIDEPQNPVASEEVDEPSAPAIENAIDAPTAIRCINSFIRRVYRVRRFHTKKRLKKAGRKKKIPLYIIRKPPLFKTPPKIHRNYKPRPQR